MTPTDHPPHPRPGHLHLVSANERPNIPPDGPTPAHDFASVMRFDYWGVTGLGRARVVDADGIEHCPVCDSLDKEDSTSADCVSRWHLVNRRWRWGSGGEKDVSMIYKMLWLVFAVMVIATVIGIGVLGVRTYNNDRLCEAALGSGAVWQHSDQCTPPPVDVKGLR